MKYSCVAVSSLKKFVMFSLLGGAVLTAVVSPALADSTPDGTVKEFVEKIKAAGSPSPIVEYIDWARAFAEFPEAQKSQLKITSADGMKTFFKEMLANPAKAMKAQMEARLAQLPPEQQESAKASLVQLETMMQQKEAEMKDRIAKTEYKIEGTEVDPTGKKATVKLTQTYQGQAKTEEIKLEKTGERWLLPSLSTAGAPQSAPAASAQAAPAAPAAK